MTDRWDVPSESLRRAAEAREKALREALKDVTKVLRSFVHPSTQRPDAFAALERARAILSSSPASEPQK